MRCRLLFSLSGDGFSFSGKLVGGLLNSRCKVCMLADGVEAFGVHFAGKSRSRLFHFIPLRPLPSLQIVSSLFFENLR